MRIGVVGASGRSGSLVVAAVLEESSCSLGAAIVSPDSTRAGTYVPGAGDSVRYTDSIELLAGCDGVIDFSLPHASVTAARYCSVHGIPLLIATTGHSSEQRAEIEKLSQQMPCGLTSNTSLGAAVLGILAELAQGLLGGGYDVEVAEIHHKMKRDAPSGTATSLVQGLTKAGGISVFGREGLRNPGEVGVVSLRGGDVPGDHTVFFFGLGERLELTHRVNDRKIFARGAVTLLKRLSVLPAGLYSARELIQGAVSRG